MRKTYLTGLAMLSKQASKLNVPFRAGVGWSGYDMHIMNRRGNIKATIMNHDGRAFRVAHLTPGVEFQGGAVYHGGRTFTRASSAVRYAAGITSATTRAKLIARLPKSGRGSQSVSKLIQRHAPIHSLRKMVASTERRYGKRLGTPVRKSSATVKQHMARGKGGKTHTVKRHTRKVSRRRR